MEQVKAVSPCVSVHILANLIQNTLLKAKGDAFGIPFVMLWD